MNSYCTAESLYPKRINLLHNKMRQSRAQSNDVNRMNFYFRGGVISLFTTLEGHLPNNKVKGLN